MLVASSSLIIQQISPLAVVIVAFLLFFFFGFFVLFVLFLETGCCDVTQAGLKLVITLPQPPIVGIYVRTTTQLIQTHH